MYWAYKSSAGELPSSKSRTSSARRPRAEPEVAAQGSLAHLPRTPSRHADARDKQGLASQRPPSRDALVERVCGRSVVQDAECSKENSVFKMPGRMKVRSYPHPHPGASCRLQSCLRAPVPAQRSAVQDPSTRKEARTNRCPVALQDLVGSIKSAARRSRGLMHYGYFAHLDDRDSSLYKFGLPPPDSRGSWTSPATTCLGQRAGAGPWSVPRVV
ncbi:hypothetical protein DFH09DRAFT_1095550 [Mycena vulgaris]|nr:hypothetical protein DFH09DRAFT_1095550 [Mycena vulgaris]